MPPKLPSFQASKYFYLGVFLPVQCHCCSLADMCLRWRGCWLAMGEWPWTGAWRWRWGAVCALKLVLQNYEGEQIISKINWERNEKGRLRHFFFHFSHSVASRWIVGRWNIRYLCEDMRMNWKRCRETHFLMGSDCHCILSQEGIFMHFSSFQEMLHILNRYR